MASKTATFRGALVAVGVGRIGKYDYCSSVSFVQGTWRPLVGSTPYQGQTGTIQHGQECRPEMNCPRSCVRAAIAAIREHHPYETPLINVVPLLTDLDT